MLRENGNPGYSDWSGIYSATPSYILQSDFAYMIGPEMFRTFVLPHIEDACQRLDNAIYHLDGVGQLAHLDMLLALPRLKAVQWVYGDGKPSARHWMEVYQKIARAGKRNFVIGDVREVCGQLGGNAYCTLGVNARAEGEELLRSLGTPV